MKKMPLILLERTKLRPFRLEDADIVHHLAGDEFVAKTTLYIPHPYPEGEAERWIGTHEKDWINSRAITLAIENNNTKALMGAITLGINKSYDHGEIAYWVGKPYINQGYGTEAAEGLLRYGFSELKLNRVYARFMDNNPASGKIMEKLGMKYEGCLRKHVKKWDKYYDLYHYGILKEEYVGRRENKDIGAGVK